MRTLLVFGLAVSVGIVAQGQQTLLLPITVVDAHLSPAKPVRHVRVQIGMLSGAVAISHSKLLTNDKGDLSAPIDTETLGSAKLLVSIEPGDAPGLVIWEPAGGIVETLPPELTVKLLPRGSPALLGPAQIEALLFKFTQTSNSLRIRNAVLQNKLSQAEAKLEADSQARRALDEAQADWAQEYGFTFSEIKEKVADWADQVHAQEEKATLRQKMLGAFARGDYAETVRLVEQGEADADNGIDSDERTYLKTLRKSLQYRLELTETEIKAQQAQSRFESAAAAAEYGVSRVKAKLDRYPADKELRSIWMSAALDAADADGREAAVAEGREVRVFLEKSISTCFEVLARIQLPEDRGAWARAQMSLGTAYLYQAGSSTGDEAKNLVARAIEAYSHALEVYNKAELPQNWAGAQENLGAAYVLEATWSTGDEANKLSASAVEANNHALEVFTKADSPQGWANTQINLGFAYLCRAQWSPGDESKRLFASAVESFNHALEVFTMAELPQKWARVQQGLGNAYSGQGHRSTGDEAKKLFASAEEAYNHALEVFTRGDFPQDWARTQMSLGIAYLYRGEWSLGDDSKKSLARAVEAFTDSLEVFNKADLPQDWALTQMNLGIAYFGQGERSTGEEAKKLFSSAVEAYCHALEILTKADQPQNWANTQMNLGIVYDNEGKQSTGGEAKTLFANAVEAYSHGLEIFTKADLPQDWAIAQQNLGTGYLDNGLLSKGEEAKELFAKAVEAYIHSLEVFTKADLPQDWVITQNDLGTAYVGQGRLSTGEEAREFFKKGVEAYQRALEVYTKQDRPREAAYLVQALAVIYHENLMDFPRARSNTELLAKLQPALPELHSNLMESYLTDSSYSLCLNQASFVKGDLHSLESIASSLLLATCLWGSGSRTEAVHDLSRLEGKGSLLDGEQGWTTRGDRFFLAQSPAFGDGRDEWVAIYAALEDHSAEEWNRAVLALEVALNKAMKEQK